MSDSDFIQEGDLSHLDLDASVYDGYEVLTDLNFDIYISPEEELEMDIANAQAVRQDGLAGAFRNIPLGKLVL